MTWGDRLISLLSFRSLNPPSRSTLTPCTRSVFLYFPLSSHWIVRALPSLTHRRPPPAPRGDARRGHSAHHRAQHPSGHCPASNTPHQGPLCDGHDRVSASPSSPPGSPQLTACLVSFHLIVSAHRARPSPFRVRSPGGERASSTRARKSSLISSRASMSCSIGEPATVDAARVEQSD